MPFPLSRPVASEASSAGAAAPEPVRLPRDELTHDYPVEWWYFAGHLADVATGERLSFMLTAIRGTLSVLPPATVSFFKRIDHQAGPLPLLQCAEPFFAAYEGSEHPVSYRFRYHGSIFNVWVASPDAWQIDGAPGHYSLQLWNGARGIELDLALDATGPAVLLHGDGVVDYGNGQQLAYYVRPRITVQGRVDFGGRLRAVRGSGWYERQWGSVPTDAYAWKYLNLTLDDGERWIVFHTKLGGAERWYAGRMPAGDGLDESPLEASGFRDVTVSGRPLGTDLTLATSAGPLELRVRPLFGDEKDIESIYPGVPPFWESVCRVEGTRAGVPVQGWSMTELHGYG